MGFALICIVSIVALGAVAAIASMLTKGGTDEPIALGEDCSTCSSHANGTCQIACLMDEKRKKLAEKQ